MTISRTIEFRNQREHAEQFPCPYCHAAPGETCRNSANGELLVNLPAHLTRLQTRDPGTKQP